MGSAFFIRRETFQALGGFDEEMNEEAVDMCKRLRALGRHVMLDETVRSSARRYERAGFTKTLLAWVFTIALTYFGIRAVSIEKYVWSVVR
jgi:GT2 family glycosyltransferase